MAPFMLVLAALVIGFVLENQQSVTLQIFGWAAPSLPVAVLILTALLAGLVLGPLLGVCIALRTKRRLRKGDF